ncbi:unnamed protein product [Mytilus coruscus]|uniref:CUBN n=1 Tax=Mytilus coruscus TaxID=42192 RepID=A0A6J8AXF6_MYTCO|nr:unnamed protein product [Mytilus coruscus]
MERDKNTSGHFPASLPPSPPGNIRIESTGREFLIRWQPPMLMNGEILSYLINYNILPSLKVYTIVVKGNQSFALTPFGDHLGQLFLISLQAENDYGLSKQSIPRYIRAGCGNQLYIGANGTHRVESPLYPHKFHQGVLCVWNIFTNKTHTISIHISDIDFGTDNSGCANNFLMIESDKVKRKICTKTSDIRFEDSDVRIVFQSKIGNVGKGFSILVKTVVKNSKPPVNITLSHLGNVILVTWSPPPGNHLPITSYKLCYKPLPHYSKICIIVLANRGNRFIINTQGHNGQLFLVTMTARIGDVESEFSMNKYLRASCSKSIKVNPRQIINITSPGYSRNYPPGVICQWTVQTADQTPLRIRRIWIDIQNTTACNSDFLKFTSTKIERICGSSRSSSTMIFSNSIAEVTFVSDNTIQGRGFLLQAIGSQHTVKITTTVFPYQHNRPSISTIPSSLSTTSGYQVESTVEELTFPTKKLLSSTFMSIITSSSQRMITSSQRMITSSQRMIASPQNMITSTQNMVTSSQNVDLTPAVDENSTWFNMSSTHTVTSLTGISTSSEQNSNSSKHYMTTSHETHHGFTSSSTVMFDKTIESSTLGSETSIIDNRYSVTPGKEISPTINRANNITEVSRTDLNASHPVYLMLMFMFNYTTGIDLDTKSIVKDLRTELIPFFNNTNYFRDLVVTKWRILRGIVPVQIKVVYNTIDLLDILKSNSTFKLMRHVNHTSFYELMNTNYVWHHNLRLAKASLRKFRKSSNFASQEIKSPCDLIKDVCQNCKTSSNAKHGVLCSFIIPSTTARNILPADTPHASNPIMIILGLSVPIVVLAIFTVGICLRRRNILTNHIVVEGNNNNVPVHDFIRKKRSGNVIMTGFSATKPVKKTKKRGWSLPCRIILEKQKNEHNIEQKTKKLGRFIEDTDTLKERLRVKNRLRRGESF